METAWSTMWNVTDETPVNCEWFLAGGGMYLFLKVHFFNIKCWLLAPHMYIIYMYLYLKEPFVIAPH